MDTRIESTISAAFKLLFPEKAAPALDDENRLKLSVEDVSLFITTQICLPIITGIISSILYEKFKTISNHEHARVAMEEAKKCLDEGGGFSPVDAELKAHTIDSLRNNGYSEREADALSDQLIATANQSIGPVNENAEVKGKGAGGSA